MAGGKTGTGTMEGTTGNLLPTTTPIFTFALIAAPETAGALVGATLPPYVLPMYEYTVVPAAVVVAV